MMKNIVVVDLEHTLSNAFHRMHLLKTDNKKFNEEFENDMPNDNMIRFIKSLWNEEYYIVILSAKKSKYRDTCIHWMRRNDINYHELVMQEDNDKRKHFEFKSDYVKDYKEKILMAFDDVGANCAMFESYGIPCLKIIQEKK